MRVLFAGVNMNIKRVQILNLVINMGRCFMQLLNNFSPQKKPNARGGSEQVEVNPFKYISPVTDDILVFLNALFFMDSPFSCFQI